MRNEIILKRSIEKDFDKWYKGDFNNSVLYVRGPRQIGKTFTILRYAKRRFKNVVYIDLSKQKDFVDVALNVFYESKKSLQVIEDYCSTHDFSFTPDNDTVVILDEIQESSDVYNNLRCLSRVIPCRWIATGSYLGLIAGSPEFKETAGALTIIDMNPITFGEFCDIFNVEYKEPEVNEYDDNRKRIPSTIENLYNLYRMIGGYPPVIKMFIDTRDIRKCNEELQRIWNVFVNESAKYFNGIKDTKNLEDCIRLAVKSVINSKKGIEYYDSTDKDVTTVITDISTVLKISTKEQYYVFRWLCDCGIFCMIDVLPKIGDITTLDRRVKLYFRDVGLARYILNRYEFNSIEGIITECFVLAETVTSPYSVLKDSINSYHRIHCLFDSNHELDFVFRDPRDNLHDFGLEVKTVKGSADSMQFFLKKNRIDYGIKVGSYKAESTGKRTFNWSVYTVGRLDVAAIIDELGARHVMDASYVDSSQFSSLADRYFIKTDDDDDDSDGETSLFD